MILLLKSIGNSKGSSILSINSSFTTWCCEKKSVVALVMMLLLRVKFVTKERERERALLCFLC